MAKEHNKVQRIRKFKGSIAITIIYAIFILLISIAGLVSTSAREIIFVQNRAFTVTFITGTVIIIIIMLINLFNKKKEPETLPPSSKYSGERLECPDFWVLKETPKAELENIPDSAIRQKLKYYCEDPRAPKNHTPDDYKAPISGFSGTDLEKKEIKALIKIRDNINHDTNGIHTDYHMTCNRMYPDYMTHIDKTEFPDNPTTLRCEYIKKCSDDAVLNRKIPWSSLCS